MNKIFESTPGGVRDLNQFIRICWLTPRDNKINTVVEKIVEAVDPAFDPNDKDKCRTYQILNSFIEQFAEQKEKLEKVVENKSINPAMQMLLQQRIVKEQEIERKKQNVRLANLEAFIRLALSLSSTEPRNLSVILNSMSDENFAKLLELLKSMTPENIEHVIKRLSGVKDPALTYIMGLVNDNDKLENVLIGLNDLNQNPKHMHSLILLFDHATINDAGKINLNTFYIRPHLKTLVDESCASIRKIMDIVSVTNVSLPECISAPDSVTVT